MSKKELFEIIYEDDNLVVVNKPAGLLTIPDRYDKEAPNLDHILSEVYGDVFVCHRLDKETSGVLVFAKNAESHRHLSIQFQEHTIKKIYHAVVMGVIRDEELNIDIPLMPNPANKPGVIPSLRGKESLTILKVMERFRAATFVECNLVTGRHHQLRAHVAAVGHPLLVDPLYGGAEGFLTSSIKKRFNVKKRTEELPLIDRITMHAYSIEIVNPANDEEKLVFSAEYPKDFRALLQVLRKYSSVPKVSFF